MARDARSASVELECQAIVGVGTDTQAMKRIGHEKDWTNISGSQGYSNQHIMHYVAPHAAITRHSTIKVVRHGS